MNPVVIDTNCLLQIIARKSPVLRTIPFPQLHLVTLDEFMTTDIVNHYTSE